MPIITRRALGQGLAALPALLTRRADAAEFSYKFATNQPPSHPSNVRAQQAIDRIREQTGGRLQIQLFPNNQLGGDTDMMSQLRSGAIQFFPLSGLIVQTIVPVAGANGVGFAFKDYDMVWAAMDGEFGAYIRRAMEPAGFYTFPKIWDNGFRQITAGAKPIARPDDLNGFKIRVPVMPLETSLFESYGASPTSINIKEAYSALQTRLVDGEENPLSIIYNWKFYEVQKYCSLTSHMWDGFWVLANKRAWERLPKDVQDVVSKNIEQAAQEQRADIRKLNEGLQSELEKLGMTFNTPDTEPFRAKLRSAGFYAKWRDTFGPECWGLLEKYTGKLA
ncbi:MAG: TRAP transporter substrate-binding protein [Acidisphaera sp.]|nr:TRAP transporter substrate-binding protein [Acidisphaera sp.]